MSAKFPGGGGGGGGQDLFLARSLLHCTTHARILGFMEKIFLAWPGHHFAYPCLDNVKMH